ncbi:MAG: VOC family protein [Candidatus Methylomirabilaceae bacterium]
MVQRKDQRRAAFGGSKKAVNHSGPWLNSVQPVERHFPCLQDNGGSSILVWLREDTSQMGVKGIPEGSSVVIPRLFCRDVAAEIEFCKNTFGASELGRRPGPDGTAAHALMTIGPEMIMIEAEWPGLASRAPKPDGSSPVVIYVYVEDVDQTVERAVAGGAKILFPVGNQFWGDRIGWVMDPSGHVWTVATRIEETTEGERQRRWSSILGRSDPGTAPESR